MRASNRHLAIVMAVALALTLLTSAPAMALPEHGTLQTTWAPMAEASHADRRVVLRTVAGYQDAVLAPAARFSGHSLIPGVPFPFGMDLTLNLVSRPFGVFEQIQFRTGIWVQADSFAPAVLSLRLLTRKGPGGVTFGIEPHVVAGFDLNVASMRAYASRRWARVFLTGGGEMGAMWAKPSSVPVGGLFAGAGFVVVPQFLGASIEGGSNIVSRHRVMVNLTLDLWGFQLIGGVGVAAVGQQTDPGFQAVISVPMGKTAISGGSEEPR
jgi:hypothetical protein